MSKPKRPRSASWRPALKGEAGALTLSYVIIVPVFLFGIMVIVQAAYWYLGRETVLAAARHGADVARTAQPPPGQAAQAAMDFASSSAGFLSHVSASTKGSSATTVRVSVSARIPTFVPDLAISVHEVVTAPVERFVALGALPDSS
ncbi:MAG TPA: TadE family protein [Streptosporangiaceae bacterium]|nr:TadE family protein [Streptosporangiaceae bacterium]